MSKIEKLLSRFQDIPRDFEWSELLTILNYFNYEETKNGKTGGSRRKFYNEENNNVIILHEPHPKKVMKEYAIKEVLDHLKRKGLISDE
ncbi:type II toxin-antitoxin system HicA family toxin [Chitinophaga tropicalis]|uniref:Addiction module toxin, HicA family n=1 Tax=Chitinophaga tropicalis TaxID=2683588 RepID=A0A7K1U2F8_9BACT|nr:type II toxin-antitoxin system HicA family toxin [Chitinophaga tropicalis]MVT08547.1 addiction module toxin, HicA family [Chitinophaga tropicalis]